jgi:hypothetical protein
VDFLTKMYELIYNYLKAEPRSRYRVNRMRSVVNLLLKDYPELSEIPKDKLIDFIHDAESYNRIFRKVLEENPEMIPETDKFTKEVVEQNYLLKVG